MLNIYPMILYCWTFLPDHGQAANLLNSQGASQKQQQKFTNSKIFGNLIQAYYHIVASNPMI